MEKSLFRQYARAGATPSQGGGLTPYDERTWAVGSTTPSGHPFARIEVCLMGS